MIKKKSFLICAGVLVTLFAASLCIGNLTVEAAQKVYRMKIQSAWPRADISMQTLAKFAAAADKRSNGQIKIQVFAAPEIVPGEQTLEATKKGTLDMLHSIGAYWGGTTPIGEIEFGLPLMWAMPLGKTVKENSEIVRNFFLNSGFAELLRREYAKQGVYWLDMHSYGELFTMAREPITSCADMQGEEIPGRRCMDRFLQYDGRTRDFCGRRGSLYGIEQRGYRYHPVGCQCGYRDEYTGSGSV